MDDGGSYEARKSAPKDRVEVRVRAERRRQWTSEDKLRIVRETLQAGMMARAVAEKYGISTGLLYTCRKQILTAAMTGFAAVEMASEPQALPGLAEADAAVEPLDDSALRPTAADMEVSVEVNLPNGARVRVGNGASAPLLSGVFAALDQL